MARIGEGDSRWIVKERQDGTNVNAWHWTEKDVSKWTEQRLGELLGGLQLFSNDAGSAATIELEAVKGDSFINVRKGKLIASYELDVSVGWAFKAAADGDGEDVRGWLQLPYLSEENHDEDPELQIYISNEVPGAKSVKSSIHANRKVIFEKVHQFIKELRAGGPHAPGAPAQAPNGAAAGGGFRPAAAAPAGSSAPADSAGPQAATGTPVPAQSAKPKPAPQPKAATKRDDGGATQSLELTEKFYARPADIYEALTDERRLRAFTQSEATSQPHPGGAFSMYGGSVGGRYLAVDAPRQLVQEWRFSSWPDGTASQVDITLEEPDAGTTVLRLKQTGIPHEDRFGNADVLRSVEAGWQDQIFRRIKMVFGYGM